MSHDAIESKFYKNYRKNNDYCAAVIMHLTAHYPELHVSAV